MSSTQRHQSRRARQHLSIAAPIFHHGKGGALHLSQKARSFGGLITSCAAVNQAPYSCPTEYSRLQSRALSSREHLTVRVIHGEAVHGFSTAGMLGRGLLRFLLAVLLQPGAALRDGGGQAHGHHDVVVQRLHLQAVLLVRCDDGHDGQGAAAESAIGFGETPAGGRSAKAGSRRAASFQHLPYEKRQFLSTLPRAVHCTSSRTACQVSFTNIFGSILALRKGPRIF